MRKFVSFIFTIFFCLAVYAEKIPLKEKPPKENGSGSINDRSEILVPNASIDGGVINIETALASWGVTVTIYNGDGAVVYTSVSASESQSHNFEVGTLPSGDYTLEVQIGEDLYEGNFIFND